eukprot:229576_1
MGWLRMLTVLLFVHILFDNYNALSICGETDNIFLVNSIIFEKDNDVASIRRFMNDITYNALSNQSGIATILYGAYNLNVLPLNYTKTHNIHKKLTIINKHLQKLSAVIQKVDNASISSTLLAVERMFLQITSETSQNNLFVVDAKLKIPLQICKHIKFAMHRHKKEINLYFMKMKHDGYKFQVEYICEYNTNCDEYNIIDNIYDVTCPELPHSESIHRRKLLQFCGQDVAIELPEPELELDETVMSEFCAFPDPLKPNTPYLPCDEDDIHCEMHPVPNPYYPYTLRDPSISLVKVMVMYTDDVLNSSIIGNYIESFDCTREEGGGWFGGVDYNHCFRKDEWLIWNTGCGWEIGRHEIVHDEYTNWQLYARYYTGQCNEIPETGLTTEALTTNTFYDGFGALISNLTSCVYGVDGSAASGCSLSAFEAWTDVLTLGEGGNVYEGTTIDVGKDVFNEIFRNSEDQPIIRRQCSNCADGFGDIYYKRLRNVDTFNAYSNMKSTWSDTDNELGVDFNLYTSLQDALTNTNAWQICNYNDYTNSIGAFRDCGPTQTIANQWTANNKGKNSKFSIYTPAYRAGMIVTATNPSRQIPQTCNFRELFPVEKGLQIYIGTGDNILETLTIDKIDINVDYLNYDDPDYFVFESKGNCVAGGPGVESSTPYFENGKTLYGLTSEQCKKELMSKYNENSAYIWAEYSGDLDKICKIGQNTGYHGNGNDPYRCMLIAGATGNYNTSIHITTGECSPGGPGPVSPNPKRASINVTDVSFKKCTEIIKIWYEQISWMNLKWADYSGYDTRKCSVGSNTGYIGNGIGPHKCILIANADGNNDGVAATTTNGQCRGGGPGPVSNKPHFTNGIIINGVSYSECREKLKLKYTLDQSYIWAEHSGDRTRMCFIGQNTGYIGNGVDEYKCIQIRNAYGNHLTNYIDTTRRRLNVDNPQPPPAKLGQRSVRNFKESAKAYHRTHVENNQNAKDETKDQSILDEAGWWVLAAINERNKLIEYVYPPVSPNDFAIFKKNVFAKGDKIQLTGDLSLNLNYTIDVKIKRIFDIHFGTGFQWPFEQVKDMTVGFELDIGVVVEADLHATGKLKFKYKLFEWKPEVPWVFWEDGIFPVVFTPFFTLLFTVAAEGNIRYTPRYTYNNSVRVELAYHQNQFIPTTKQIKDERNVEIRGFQEWPQEQLTFDAGINTEFGIYLYDILKLYISLSIPKISFSINVPGSDNCDIPFHNSLDYACGPLAVSVPTRITVGAKFGASIEQAFESFIDTGVTWKPISQEIFSVPLPLKTFCFPFNNNGCSELLEVCYGHTGDGDLEIYDRTHEKLHTDKHHDLWPWSITGQNCMVTDTWKGSGRIWTGWSFDSCSNDEFQIYSIRYWKSDQYITLNSFTGSSQCVSEDGDNFSVGYLGSEHDCSEMHVAVDDPYVQDGHVWEEHGSVVCENAVSNSNGYLIWNHYAIITIYCLVFVLIASLSGYVYCITSKIKNIKYARVNIEDSMDGKV